MQTLKKMPAFPSDSLVVSACLRAGTSGLQQYFIASLQCLIFKKN